MASRIPELIDALMAQLTADPGLSGVVVVDGPEMSEAKSPDWLVVGFNGDPDGDFQAAQALGGWASLATGREEQIELTVAAIATRGETEVRAARQRVYEIGARLEALLAADPSVGLRSLEVAIEASQLVQVQTDQGVQARLLLTVAGRAFT
ncbi:hypothetical protein OG909_24720 [Streptomyces sp. NBC_01754]|uniref:hypothetical protein n=1 Tax=Streptomyces sp. NBC_01754 TaxID=2975930 RepID=UPI002DD7EDE9|nr:hypothetical protein [Streptomyces sp. NBC_01754]WSC95219.1 hypothetical protein OG909_24720 [Streptomyces sp. NBC_01754]